MKTLRTGEAQRTAMRETGERHGQSHRKEKSHSGEVGIGEKHIGEAPRTITRECGEALRRGTEDGHSGETLRTGAEGTEERRGIEDATKRH